MDWQPCSRPTVFLGGRSRQGPVIALYGLRLAWGNLRPATLFHVTSGRNVACICHCKRLGRTNWLRELRLCSTRVYNFCVLSHYCHCECPLAVTGVCGPPKRFECLALCKEAVVQPLALWVLCIGKMDCVGLWPVKDTNLLHVCAIDFFFKIRSGVGFFVSKYLFEIFQIEMQFGLGFFYWGFAFKIVATLHKTCTRCTFILEFNISTLMV